MKKYKLSEDLGVLVYIEAMHDYQVVSLKKDSTYMGNMINKSPIQPPVYYLKTVYKSDIMYIPAEFVKEDNQ